MKKDKKENNKEVFLNPQQEAALAYYTDPSSDTFGNLSQSLIRAKYSKSYADNVTAIAPEWLYGNIGDMKRLRKAEQVLDETLNTSHIVPAVGAFGIVRDKRTKKIVMEVSPQILKVKNDAAKFYAERLDKKKYSTRSELTGKGGRDLLPSSLDDMSNEQLEQLLNERTATAKD